MKIALPKPLAAKVVNAENQVSIAHHHSVKSSSNYQSAESSYGVTLVCSDTPEAIRETIKRAEKIVMDAIVPKVKAQVKFLNDLSG